MPLVDGSSEYGASSAAVRVPSAPSRKPFKAPVLQPGIGGATLRAPVLQVHQWKIEWQPFRDPRSELLFLLQVVVQPESPPTSELSCAEVTPFCASSCRTSSIPFRRSSSRRIRNALSDHFLGIFFQQTVGSPSAKRSISPPSGFGVSGGDLRMLQGQRVGDGDVAGNVIQVDGIVGRGLVEVQPGGKFLVGPARLVPAAAEDPFAGFAVFPRPL